MDDISDILGEYIPVRVNIKNTNNWALYFIAFNVDSALLKTREMDFITDGYKMVDLDEIPKTPMYDRALKWVKFNKIKEKNSSANAYYVGKTEHNS